MPRSRASSPSPGGRARRTPRPPSVAWCDEAKAAASLRATADPLSDRIDARWSDGISLDLSVLTRPVLTGTLDLRVEAGGQVLPVPRTPECVLWHSDKDCDYLELQSPLGTGVLEYQILLARKDRYAHLAVKVAGLESQPTAVTLRWPLAAAAVAVEESATREIVIRETSGKPVTSVRAFPLGLPQDRWLSTAGRFAVVDGAIELHQVGPGTGVYVPLILDWNPLRRRQPADWRTLTIAEEGEVLRSDQAAAHRIRIGLEHHLLIYHSLLRSEVGRSVLGQNTRHETLVGLFSDCGNVELVMAVE